MTLTIGLTGSIASGKSTVSNMFRKLNIPVIDADEIARDVVEPGNTAYNDIVDLFGKDILLNDGMIDRKKLGSIIFADKEKRIQLNEIVHPAVRKRMLKEKDMYQKEGEKCIVLDIPLLFESKLTHMVEKIIVVYVDEKVQIHRLMKRNKMNVKTANERINAQISLKEKAKLADEVIDNNNSIEETNRQLHVYLKKWDII